MDENSGLSNEHAVDGHVGPPEMFEHLQDGVSTSAMGEVSRYCDPYNDPIEKDPIPVPGRYSPIVGGIVGCPSQPPNLGSIHNSVELASFSRLS